MVHVISYMYNKYCEGHVERSRGESETSLKCFFSYIHLWLFRSYTSMYEQKLSTDILVVASSNFMRACAVRVCGGI